MLELKIYTVQEFNQKVKEYLEDNQEFREFLLEGEMSGVTYYKSGHLYFNLKDKKSQIKCVAFNYRLKRISEDLKEGDAVKILCDVGFYENRGEFQILVRAIEKKNMLGEMYEKLEKLKVEMREKGYFDQKYKKKLPKYPMNIGVVTAITGAAIQDIIKTTRKRDDRINIYIYPAKVQGVGASEEIVKGIETLNKIPEIDMIIAGRGGGSVEDLWCFNEENTAMAFFNSQKPIISAVGHESDNLLSDLTADVRAATPTQAIELSVPEKQILKEGIEDRKKYLNILIQNLIKNKRKEIETRYDNYYIKNFIKEIEKKNQLILDKENHLNKAMRLYFEKIRNNFENRVEKITLLNPIAMLNRGYSIVTHSSKTITSVKNISVDDEIEIKFNDGSLKATVKEIIE